MKKHFRNIGQLICEIKAKNADNQVNTLLGININKFFMPSVANIVGTDLSVYKIVKKGQFACNRMHVGRDMRLPIALSDKENNFIVSPAYDVFEIIDETQLLPEYLMMWFSRKEFDRNTWFYTDADVRGGLSWKSFCDMTVPVPSLLTQRAIVREYKIIQARVKINNALIQKLEDTAQAIYKHWFVDFEFPSDNGKAYKSNGGEMVESELGEVPVGWKVEKIGELCKCNITSLSPKDTFDTIKYLDTSNITNNEIEELQILNLSSDEIPSRARRKVLNNDIVFSTVRPNLRHFGILKKPDNNMIVSTGFCVLTINYPNLCSELVYLELIKEETLQTLQARAEMSVSTYPSVTSEDLLNLDFILPTPEILKKAKLIFVPIFEFLWKIKSEKKLLTDLQHLLLSKLSTVGE